MRARFVLSEVGNGLRRNLTMTIAVIITVGVSLALFGVALLVRSQVDTMKDFWFDKVEVSIFLCNDNSETASCAGGKVTDAQKEQIEADLESLKPLVQEIYFETQQEAYDRFIVQYRNSPIVDSVTVVGSASSVTDVNTVPVVATFSKFPPVFPVMLTLKLSSACTYASSARTGTSTNPLVWPTAIVICEPFDSVSTRSEPVTALPTLAV
mgnify:CR=1 FL=1